MQDRRRRVLKGVAAAGALVLAGRDALAQTRGLSPVGGPGESAEARRSLLGLPRYALVIGNARYREAPLRNPANDANAIAAELKGLGFEVAQALDAGRSAMIEAIEAYGSSLGRERAIGLFYFAGHGVQLAWRNYLVPVDAVIDSPDDVRSRAVDLSALLERLVRAKNPMNVIILDACRDNPFGSRLTGAQRGLSQFDAPLGSLLAYSTAPGNVAGDGDGEHGIYTENLLRELKVPEAKIEDVFKRVRLNVRRRTRGQQIPWESTSLEEDFYFVPPKAVAMADEEAARERKRQLAALEKQRAEQEAELKRRQEQALQEAQRLAEEAERKRREAEILAEARHAQEEAERRFKEETARREQERLAAEAERKRREEQVLLEARRAQEEAERKFREELARREKQLAQEEAERRRRQPPVAKPDPAAEERQFREELAFWEKVSASTEPAPLEAYLLRYPSGRFAELAQLQLNRILAARGEKPVEIVSAKENPYSRGSAVAGTRYSIGDSYTYRVIDLYTRLESQTFTQTVTQITDREIVFDDGRIVTDLLGNLVRSRDGRKFGPSQFMPLEFAVGKRWSTRFRVSHPKAGELEVNIDLQIAARESIAVPAGTFDAFRLEGNGWSRGAGVNTQVFRRAWYAPDRVRRWIASEDLRKGGGVNVIVSEREELVSFRQS